MPEHNLPGGLAVAQKADGLTICEEQIRKVERDWVALRQYVERLTQLVDILCVESAADGQHGHRAVSRALYLEHRPVAPDASFGPVESLNWRARRTLACARVSPMVKTRTTPRQECFGSFVRKRLLLIFSMRILASS
ncbi:MAG TPA: hypothetical protein VNW92_31690, partial [Polyangiaceae bacterium]|nr:hypothetical protein [Polyangiaceae bacterium]